MGRDFGGSRSERPAIEVHLPAFRIDRFEVSNFEFSQFIYGDGYKNEEYWSDAGWAWKESLGIEEPAYWQNPDLGPSHPNAPVVGVSWYEAEAYANFSKARLPTEAEWERAARGTDGVRDYPWEAETILNVQSNSYRANFRHRTSDQNGTMHTASRTFFPEDESACGCRHMAGNVAEWCQDSYEKGYYARGGDYDNPVCENSSNQKVIRGGAWSLPAHRLCVTQRSSADREKRFSYVGFRLVRDADQ